MGKSALFESYLQGYPQESWVCLILSYR